MPDEFEIKLKEVSEIIYTVVVSKSDQCHNYESSKAELAKAIEAIGPDTSLDDAKKKIVRYDLTIDGEELCDCYIDLSY